MVRLSPSTPLVRPIALLGNNVKPEKDFIKISNGIKRISFSQRQFGVKLDPGHAGRIVLVRPRSKLGIGGHGATF
jgi:hypothetical protein